MAKSARANSKKKLRTQRREQVTEKTQWLKTADEKRQAALAACMAAEPLPVAPTVPEENAGMEAERPAAATTTRVKKVGKLKGVAKKKGSKKVRGVNT